MRWDNLYLAGVGTYLPERVQTVDEAISAGRYTEEKKAMNGYRAVRLAEDHETGPSMAVRAARQAISRSGIDPEDFGLVVHSYIGHQGYDLWTPASYIQRETVGGQAPSFEIKQGCNGFMAGTEVAASYLAGRPDVRAALVTGGDSFRLPWIDRWSSHEQNVDGDGAGAFVLSNQGGFARIRATYSLGDPALEPMGRTTREPTHGPFSDGKALTLDTSLRDYMDIEGADLDDVVERISGGVQSSVNHVLEDAGVKLDDVRFFLHQQLAETIAVHGLYELLGVDRSSTTFDWGKDLGMVGTVDLVLALNQVLTTRDPKPGDLVVLQSAGAGYVWSTALIEILETPPWAGA